MKPRIIFSFLPAWLFFLMMASCSNPCSSDNGQSPEVGKAARYCNPLPMAIGPGGNASGDVTVIKEDGKYYMF